MTALKIPEIPALGVPSSDVTRLFQEDFPNVTYWTSKSWKEFTDAKKDSSQGASRVANRGGAAAAAGVNVAMRYVQFEDGETIDGNHATQIRRYARGLWQKYLDVGMAPKKWGSANSDIDRLYNTQMEAQFPELRLCDNHWKTTLIATQNYPTWRSNAQPTSQEPTVKPEPQLDGDLLDPSTSSKHSHTSGNSPSKKRLKHGREKNSRKQVDPPRLSPLSVQAIESQS